jgi:CBS domain-containing protein
MLVKDLMNNHVESVLPNSTVLQAAKKMRDLNVGIIPVINESGNIEGLLTDRDIVVRVLADELNPSNTSVREVMTADIQFCSENSSIEEAAKIMERHKIRRILVKNDGKITGIISLGDIALNVKEQLSGEILKTISKSYDR